MLLPLNVFLVEASGQVEDVPRKISFEGNINRFIIILPVRKLLVL